MADNVLINPGTATPIATDEVGTVQFQKVKLNLGGDGVDGATWDGKVQGGTVNAGTVAVTSFTPDIPGGTIDTVSQITNGSIVVTAGTVTTTIGDISGGTIDLNTRVGNVGTIESGTITSLGALPDLPGGTVDVVSSVAALPDLPGGTIDSITAVTTVGTVTGAGTIASIGQIHNAGTIASMPNIPGGTVGLVTSVTTVGTVTGAGTIANIGVVHNAGTIAGLPDLPGGTIDAVSALTNGSIVVTAGTITAGTVENNMLSGTLTSLTNLAGGTVQINPKSSKNIITYGTTVGGTAATGVTLLAAPGAGTSIYINEISVVNQGTATAQVHVGFGTASTLGTSHVVGGIYAGNGGIQKVFPKPVGGHITNLALLGSITAAGTANVNFSYWIE